MFTEKEISLMRKFGLDLDFDNLSDDDYVHIEDVVARKMVQTCLDEDYNPNEEGLVCEEILDKLSE
jgi:predicted AAA+ superfamily ATPase